MTKDIREQVADLQKNFLAAGVLIEGGMAKGLMKCALLVERDAKINLTDNQHVDTGRLRASYTSRLIDRPHGKTAQTGTNVDYAPDVELGSGPHHVPLEDLIAWVRRKGLAGGGFAKNKAGRGYKSGVEKDIAYQIQQHIEKYGTKPHPHLLPALKANSGRFQGIIATEIKKDMQGGVK